VALLFIFEVTSYPILSLETPDCMKVCLLHIHQKLTSTNYKHGRFKYDLQTEPHVSLEGILDWS